MDFPLGGEMLTDLRLSANIDTKPRRGGVGCLEGGVTEEALAASSSFWIAFVSSPFSFTTLFSSSLCLGDTASASSFPISASSV